MLILWILITLTLHSSFSDCANLARSSNVVPNYQHQNLRGHKRVPELRNRNLNTEFGRHQPVNRQHFNSNNNNIQQFGGNYGPHFQGQNSNENHGRYQFRTNGNNNNNNQPAVVVIETSRQPVISNSGFQYNPAMIAMENNVQPRYPIMMDSNYHQVRHNFTPVNGYDHQTSASDGWGWGGGGPLYSQHHHHHHGGWKGGGDGHKGYDFRPYFDIALTALGLLSLGTFLLNMLLNALLFSGLVTSTGTGTGIITTTTTGTATATGGGGGAITTTGGVITVTGTGPIITGGITGGISGTGFFKKRVSEVKEDDEEEEGRSLGSITGCFNDTNLYASEARTPRRSRKRREVLELFLDPATSMNSMAHSVLEGIDAMMYKKECLGKVFCEGNRHAKIVGSGFGFLMPLYSLSASYMGRKFGWHEDTPGHMKGIALGLGESNCENHFPQC